MVPAETRSPTAAWSIGDEWINPVTQFAIHVEESAASTNGARLTWVATYAPYTPVPPLHFHPRQTEEFAMISGSVRVNAGGEIRDLSPGDILTLPPGEPHQMWNPHGTPAVVRWETTPALNTERWMGLVLALAQRGRTNGRGVPSLPQLALLLRAHHEEFRLCAPPPVVQALLFPPLALVGRALGWRGDRLQ